MQNNKFFLRYASFFQTFLQQRDSKQINHSSWNSQQRRIEAIKHTSVTRKNVATVLDAQRTFEEAFHQIAPCAEYDNRQSKSCPMPHTQLCVLLGLPQQPPYQYCYTNIP